MYQLKKNTTDSFLSNSVQEEEKSGRNIYLKNSQWKALDRLSEVRDVSRNQIIRDLLDEALPEEVNQ